MRRRPPAGPLRLLAGLLLLAAAATPLRAQEEVQVALDEAGRIMEIDRSLAQRLSLLIDE